jgi:hypothetical protein
LSDRRVEEEAVKVPHTLLDAVVPLAVVMLLFPFSDPADEERRKKVFAMSKPCWAARTSFWA